MVLNIKYSTKERKQMLGLKENGQLSHLEGIISETSQNLLRELLFQQPVFGKIVSNEQFVKELV
jgi:hypothetical protein